MSTWYCRAGFRTNYESWIWSADDVDIKQKKIWINLDEKSEKKVSKCRPESALAESHVTLFERVNEILGQKVGNFLGSKSRVLIMRNTFRSGWKNRKSSEIIIKSLFGCTIQADDSASCVQLIFALISSLILLDFSSELNPVLTKQQNWP